MTSTALSPTIYESFKVLQFVRSWRKKKTEKVVNSSDFLMLTYRGHQIGNPPTTHGHPPFPCFSLSLGYSDNTQSKRHTEKRDCVMNFQLCRVGTTPQGVFFLRFSWLPVTLFLRRVCYGLHITFSFPYAEY